MNPRDLHDQGEYCKDVFGHCEPDKLTEESVSSLGHVNLSLSTRSRKSSLCSSLTDISEKESDDKPMAAVKSTVDSVNSEKLATNTSQAEEVLPVQSQKVSSATPKEDKGNSMVEDDPMTDPVVGVKLNAVPPLDSQKDGEDVPMTDPVEDDPMTDPVVGVKLNAVPPLDSQKNGEDVSMTDPVAGVKLKRPPSSQKDGEDDAMNGVVLNEPSSDVAKDGDDGGVRIVGRSKEQLSKTKDVNCTTGEISKEVPTKTMEPTISDSDLAAQLAACELRRSSRNAVKNKPSLNVSTPPRLLNVKRKPAFKKDEILFIVSVWNNTILLNLIISYSG